MNDLTSGIAPCLWFDRQAEEAAAFYTQVFAASPGGSRILTTTRYPEDAQGREGEVMTVEFVINGLHVTALNGGPQFTFSEAISLQVPCADQDEVDRYWTALTDGGEEGPCGGEAPQAERSGGGGRAGGAGGAQRGVSARES